MLIKGIRLVDMNKLETQKTTNNMQFASSGILIKLVITEDYICVYI